MRTLSLFVYFLVIFIHHTVTPKSGLPGERFPDPSNAAGSSPYLDKVKVSAKNKTNKKLKVSGVYLLLKCTCVAAGRPIPSATKKFRSNIFPAIKYF